MGRSSGKLLPHGLSAEQTEALRKDLVDLLQRAYYKRSPALCLCRDFLVDLVSGSNGAFDVFLAPIDSFLLPNFRSRVRRKMDLNLISRRLGDGEYDSSRSCFRDLLMVARNSYLYSQPSSKFHEAANLLKERLEALRERARHIGPGNGYEVNQTSSQATGQKTLNSFEDNGFLSTPAAEQAQGLFGVAEDKNLLSVVSM
mmetsp:Transcript_9375/g.25466  ORF Transcript_9375/g.25466 Transcript_9375/m.25466 type:complete len:200 (+) Transcript_9375:134-733(+)